MKTYKELVDKLNEMAVYWNGDDYETCRFVWFVVG